MKNIRTTAAVLTLAVSTALLVTVPLTALAVTPSSGPAAGGTSATIDSIHFVQISAGDSFTLGLTSEGTVFAWGYNGDGQLGNASYVDSATPVQVHGVDDSGYLTGVINISAGYTHALAVTSSGVFAWGNNDSGQLGDGSYTSSNVPVQVHGVLDVAFLSGVTAVAAGGDGNQIGDFSEALTPTGVFMWGNNDYGQLGDGTNSGSDVPVQVRDVAGTGDLTGATSIAAGRYFALALTPTGVLAWGQNGYFGCLGDGTYSNSNIPVQVKDVAGTGYLTGVTSIAAGAYHALALTATGVYAWGKNLNGRLGDGTENFSGIPVQVKDVAGTGYLTGVTSIAAGAYHSLALTPTGVVFAWGKNQSQPDESDGGQLGVGSTTDSFLPVPVQGVGGSGTLSGATSIAAGKFHSLAITPSGVYAWGTNGNGELGDGSISSTTTPVLGANFQPFSVTIGGAAGTNLSADGNLWNVTVPAGTVGTVDVIGTASLFGGTTAASPETVTFNAGSYTYVDSALASTGSSDTILPIGLTLLLIGLGLASITALSRRRTTV